MSNRIARTDVVDTDFVDAEELIADGYTTYRTVTLASTTASTKRVVITGGTLERLDNVDEPLQVGDFVEIAGSAAAGRYTCDAIIDAVTFRVSETIVDSTGGTADFIHPAGATKVGIDNTTLAYTNATTVQGALEDLAQGELPQPVQVGNVLFAVGTEQFSVAQPVTTNQGWLVNEQGILIVTPEDGYT
jgi:hypothetical protein